MNKIISIKEGSFLSDESDWSAKDGYVIETEDGNVKIGIDNGQSCCEVWGYFMSEDELDFFVGAELLDVKISDTLLKKGDFDVENMYEGDVMFVDIHTSKGVLQFVAYNAHNGYYGHEACVISKNFNHSEYL